MSIPSKGSRGVEVDEQDFRFIVKKLVVREEEDEVTFSEVTVQEVAENPGRVMQFQVEYGVPITRFMVEGIIRKALKAGWLPSERGAPYKFGV